MTETPIAPKTGPSRRRRILKGGLWSLGVLLTLWLVAAYLILPMMWRRYAARHPALTDAPRFTVTKDGIPGDPLNLALVATEDELRGAMKAAGWHPADKVTMGSSTRIVYASIFSRPYVTAPVSDLFLYGRKQDLAYQQADGKSPRKRHHVRFWRTSDVDENGRPIWFGAATYDSRVGLSHTTLQVTHHIDSDVDRERDKVLADLEKSGCVTAIDWQDDFHEQREGRNGGGDRYVTDGKLAIAFILPREVAE